MYTYPYREKHIHFNPRSPHGERRAAAPTEKQRALISIHAPRTGSDGCRRRACYSGHHFNPRSPHGERRAYRLADNKVAEFQSTLPARGATNCPLFCCTTGGISIHAPRTGSDDKEKQRHGKEADFNPRSPHGERHGRRRTSAAAKDFNPRSPHGERPTDGDAQAPPRKISIHAPRTGSDGAEHAGQRRRVISIHAPRTGSDGVRKRLNVLYIVFQSTLPARGATRYTIRISGTSGISIHAPRTGSDSTPHSTTPGQSDFNPRSPHGERPPRGGRTRRRNGISIHAPRTGSDCGHGKYCRTEQISIHAPRTGSDVAEKATWDEEKLFQSTLPARGATPGRAAVHVGIHHFNPRSPHGERLRAVDAHGQVGHISIHAPRTGSDAECPEDFDALPISIHAPRTGSDKSYQIKPGAPGNFNPRSPHGERRPAEWRTP